MASRDRNSHIIDQALQIVTRKRHNPRENRIERWIDGIENQSHCSTPTPRASVAFSDAFFDDSRSSSPVLLNTIVGNNGDNQDAGNEKGAAGGIRVTTRFSFTSTNPDIPRRQRLECQDNASIVTPASTSHSWQECFLPSLLLRCRDCSKRFPAIAQLVATQLHNHSDARAECLFCAGQQAHRHSGNPFGEAQRPHVGSRPLCDIFQDLKEQHRAHHVSGEDDCASLLPSCYDQGPTFGSDPSAGTQPIFDGSSKPRDLTVENIAVDSVAGFPFFEPRQDRASYTWGEDPESEIERSMSVFYKRRSMPRRSTAPPTPPPARSAHSSARTAPSSMRGSSPSAASSAVAWGRHQPIRRLQRKIISFHDNPAFAGAARPC